MLVLTAFRSLPFTAFLPSHNRDSSLFSTPILHICNISSQKQCAYGVATSNEIFGELEKHSQTSCTECPYNPELKPEITCTRSEGMMIIPKNRKAVNRLLAHVPSSLQCFAKEGYRQWRSKYGLFVMRNKPLFVNDSSMCDNHFCDCFIRVKIKRTKNDKIYEKEIAVRPILTIWIDTASSYITGWAISIIPNADTIAEAFARACVYTVGDIAAGIPKRVILDCGHDMKSKLLDDPCSKYTLDNWDDSFLNERFLGLGIFQALGCEVQRNLPYSPQSKAGVERFFRILEEKFISKLCGWCHNSVAERPEGFAKKLQQLLEEKRLLTFEEFVDYFQNVILPTYHGMTENLDEASHAEEAIDDGYTLSLESMSPAQKYRNLEKARNVIPDWKTMGILMRHYEPDATEIKQYGVRFAGIYYQHEKLNEYAGQRASILYHSYCKPFAPSSIIVIVEGKAICEAFPAYRNKMSGESPAKLSEDRRIQNAPSIKMAKTIERIGKSVHNILPENVESHELSEKEQLQEYSFAPMPVDGNIASQENVNYTSNPDNAAKHDKNNWNEDFDAAHEFLFGKF